MSFPRKQIKANARAALSANYWPIIGYPLLLLIALETAMSVFFTVIMFGIMAVFGISTGLESLMYGEPDVAAIVVGYIIYIVIVALVGLVAMVFQVGELKFYYEFYRGSKADFGTFFTGFKNNGMWRIMGGMFLMGLYIYLWSLLLIIPGIIKTYQYRMFPYLLIDRPDLSIRECFAMTKKMTAGHKGDLFVMDLSFIGWVILSLFTCGLLAIFYVGPYMSLSQAGCYDFLKRVRMGQPGPGNGQPNPGPQQFNPNGNQNFNQGPVFQSATFESQATAQPAQAPEANYAQPVEPAQAPEASYAQPVAPAQAPETSYAQPVAPAQAPETSYAQPVEPAQAPETSYAQPVEPVQAPEASYAQPVEPAQASDTNTTGPIVVDNDDIFDE